ncbi:ABC transporter permease [Bacillus sp. ISL-51]|uniref:ABC transporter permease n=1 Tax=Bacteria TaxID=2 RepID=UPI001BE7F217|nr:MULTISPECIES: ABC transporter permease [Bacteria]MBT2574687.1 ABC transporter permease [Bacillus sp. ISL-51]MBT2711275.1 ABC transporter permease [Pseudomonas sp. ISL-88]
MRTIFQLLLLDFRLLAAQKSFYIKLILFPSLMILILGTVFHDSDSKVRPFDVAFFNADHAEQPLGDVLKDGVLKQSDIIHVKEADSYQEGKKLVASGKASVFVYVPKGFTEAAENNKKTSISVIADNKASVNGDIVETMADSFVTRIKTVYSEEKEVLKHSGHMSKAEIEKVVSGLNSHSEKAVNIPKQTAGEQASMNAMQYYSIAMVVMFSIMTAFVLVHGIVEERQQRTLFRIKSMPVLHIQYVAGKLLGIIFAILMQMAAVILISSIVYQVKWGNLFEMFLVTAVYSFAIGSMVLLWGFTAKNHAAVSSMAAPILYLFSFLGGSFIAKDNLPASLRIIQELIPNGKAINSYVSVTQHAGLSGMSMDLAELAVIGAVFLCMTIWVFKRKEPVS